MTRREFIWALSAGAIFAGTLAYTLLRYYPVLADTSAIVLLGEDYPNFFVRMVSAEFLLGHFGLQQLVWFTPAMCAGGFQFANPIDITYSLPQLLSILSNPILAVYLTHIAMTLTGGIGVFLLASRSPFSIGLWPALAASVLFSQNGFFMARMVTGHLNFHTFMLIPLMAYCLLQTNRYYWIAAGTLAALTVIGGGAHTVIPAAISILFVLLLAGQWSEAGRAVEMSLAVFVATTVALVLSAAKLGSAYALESNFPRSLYELQGFASLAETFWFPFVSIFAEASTPTSITGRWQLGDHEFDYSLSPFILFGILPACFFAIKHQPSQLVKGLLLASPLILLVCLVNYSEPGWHAFLKEVPVISSSLSLFRWYSSFLLVLCLVAGLGLQTLPARSVTLISVIVILGASSWQFIREPDWKTLDETNVAPLLAGLEKSRAGQAPTIERLAVNTFASGETAWISATSDIEFTNGASQVFCYEPIFGYFGERLEVDNLRLGPVTLIVGDQLNMKNPACYIYPEENDCVPGDNFTLAQARELYAFTRYQPWHFEQPNYQKLANLISQLGWLSIAGLVVWLFITRLRRGRNLA